MAWVTDATSVKPPHASRTSTVQLTGSRLSGVLPATSSRLVGSPSESSTTRTSLEEPCVAKLRSIHLEPAVTSSMSFAGPSPERV